MPVNLLFLISSLVILSAAPIKQIFYSQQIVATIEDNRLLEVSGLEESYLNPGYFWTHNDSGSEPVLYLINAVGEIAMEVELKGIQNRDWEEIVTVKMGGKSLIYVAETGDNKAVHKSVSLICLEEPSFDGQSRVAVAEERLKIMHFRYEEGARDAEAVLYDQSQNEFVLVTKREQNALVYAFQFEENQHPVSIKSKGTIPAKLFTAADMNEEGEVLLKHYSTIYYWGESNHSALERILAWKPETIDYTPEPQGEAICWHAGDFYTISEKNTGKPQEMLYFQRMR